MQSTANVHSHPDTSSRGWLSSVRIPLSIALLSPGFAGISLLPAAAQVAGPAQQTTAASPDAIRQREQELEATRERQAKLREQIERLKGLLEVSQRSIGLDERHFRAAISCALKLAGAEPLKADAERGGPQRFVFPALDQRDGADPT